MTCHEKSDLTWRVFNSSLPDVFIDLRVNVEFFFFGHLEMTDDLLADDLHCSGSTLVASDVPCVPQGNDKFGFVRSCHNNHLIVGACFVSSGVALRAIPYFGRSLT